MPKRLCAQRAGTARLREHADCILGCAPGRSSGLRQRGCQLPARKFLCLHCIPRKRQVARDAAQKWPRRRLRLRAFSRKRLQAVPQCRVDHWQQLYRLEITPERVCSSRQLPGASSPPNQIAYKPSSLIHPPAPRSMIRHVFVRAPYIQDLCNYYQKLPIPTFL